MAPGLFHVSISGLAIVRKRTDGYIMIYDVMTRTTTKKGKQRVMVV